MKRKEWNFKEKIKVSIVRWIINMWKESVKKLELKIKSMISI
jgi:hypothetical protein